MEFLKDAGWLIVSTWGSLIPAVCSYYLCVLVWNDEESKTITIALFVYALAFLHIWTGQPLTVHWPL